VITIHQRRGQTHERTDRRIAVAITALWVASRGKNLSTFDEIMKL